MNQFDGLHQMPTDKLRRELERGLAQITSKTGQDSVFRREHGSETADELMACVAELSTKLPDAPSEALVLGVAYLCGAISSRQLETGMENLRRRFEGRHGYSEHKIRQWLRLLNGNIPKAGQYSAERQQA